MEAQKRRKLIMNTNNPVWGIWGADEKEDKFFWGRPLQGLKGLPEKICMENGEEYKPSELIVRSQMIDSLIIKQF
jgi:hypothetical protein